MSWSYRHTPVTEAFRPYAYQGRDTLMLKGPAFEKRAGARAWTEQQEILYVKGVTDPVLLATMIEDFQEYSEIDEVIVNVENSEIDNRFDDQDFRDQDLPDYSDEQPNQREE